MRPSSIALPASLLLALSCGGSSSSGSAHLGGTISGQPFSPIESVATRAGPATCAVPVLGPIEAQALAIRFATYVNACDDFSDPFCLLHASTQNLTVLFADLSQTAGLTKLAPGTYTVQPDPTAVQPQATGPLAGTALVAYAASVTTSAQCLPSPLVGQGTLRLDQVTGDTVTGHVDVTLGHLSGGTFTGDGGSVSGDFSAPVCPTAISSTQLCALASSAGQCTAPQGPHC